MVGVALAATGHMSPLVAAVLMPLSSAVVVARYLQDVVDLHFGVGGLLHPDNAYLLTRDGRVEYVRVPTGPA